MITKKLYRSRNGRAIAGVCAGLGKYFQIDPVIIRLGFLFLAAGGPGVIIPDYVCNYTRRTLKILSLSES